MSRTPKREGPSGIRTPLLGRLRVGTKLMLLVLLPVCVLLAFTLFAAVTSWRHAADLRHFRSETRLSFATAGLADALAQERYDAVLLQLRPGPLINAQLAPAQGEVERALRKGSAGAASSNGTLVVGQTLDAARRQVQALRVQTATGTLPVQQIDDSYSLIINHLLGTAGNLSIERPTRASGRATDAYLILLTANEAAERERIDLAEALATPGRPLTGDPSASLQTKTLDAFRQNASPRLVEELDALLLQPASVGVQEVRDGLTTDPAALLQRTSLDQWLAASGGRLSALRHLESGAGNGLGAAVASDLRSAQAGSVRGLALSLSVLVIVTALALLLRRSITKPLQVLSAGARKLSRGELSFDVPYSGRDEIGDVAAAFSDLRVDAEHLASEIRSMNAAVADNGLDHRADVGAFGGTWQRLLAGMNDTIAAFEGLHHREAALRRVATLVATGVPPEEIFDAVVAEMRQLLDADAASLLRYEADGTASIIAANDPGMEIPVGARFMPDGESISALVRRTGTPAHRDASEGLPGPVAALGRDDGTQSSAGAPIVVEGRPWGVMVASWRHHQSISSNVESRMAQFTELLATAIANADGRAQLTASRARVVAAADDTRVRIERDLHDGVQQHLVSLGLELRNAEMMLPGGMPQLRSQIENIVDGLTGTLDDLREISRGIHPAILSNGGLGRALKTLARRSPVPVEVELEDGVRLPERLEVTAYYVVSEALTNVAKHAQASVVHVQLKAEDSLAVLAIRDDGVGGADPDQGSGLIGLADRVEAIGGRLRLTSEPGAGTLLLVVLPIADG